MNLEILRQMTIEDSYAKRDINKKIRKDLESTPEIEAILAEMRKSIIKYKSDYSSYWNSKINRVITLSDNNNTEDLVIYIAVAVMSITEIVPFQAAVATIANKLEGYDDFIDSIKTASELIAVCCDDGLYDVIAAKDSSTGSLMIKPLFSLDNDTVQYIMDTMYLPPLICKPSTVENNFSSGYYNPLAESVVLKKHNHHDMPLALDAINIANSTAYQLDTFILQEFEETPSKKLDTNEKVRNFMLLKNSSKYVYDLLLSEGNKFWFSWRYDKRGRMYSQGYHVNLQSTEYKKALISLADKQHIPIQRSRTTK